MNGKEFRDTLSNINNLIREIRTMKNGNQKEHILALAQLVEKSIAEDWERRCASVDARNHTRAKNGFRYEKKK